MVFTVLAFLSTSTPAQVPEKEKVVAGAERAWDHFAAQGYTVWFTRDQNGKINGMHVGASRMRDMLFVRVK